MDLTFFDGSHVSKKEYCSKKIPKKDFYFVDQFVEKESNLCQNSWV